MLFQDDTSNYFGTKHWLLKYEMIYMYVYENTGLNKYINDFYASNPKYKNIFNINTFRNNISNSKVNEFFIGLLDNKYSFRR